MRFHPDVKSAYFWCCAAQERLDGHRREAEAKAALAAEREVLRERICAQVQVRPRTCHAHTASNCKPMSLVTLQRHPCVHACKCCCLFVELVEEVAASNETLKLE